MADSKTLTAGTASTSDEITVPGNIGGGLQLKVARVADEYGDENQGVEFTLEISAGDPDNTADAFAEILDPVTPGNVVVSSQEGGLIVPLPLYANKIRLKAKTIGPSNQTVSAVMRTRVAAGTGTETRVTWT